MSCPMSGHDNSPAPDEPRTQTMICPICGAVRLYPLGRNDLRPIRIISPPCKLCGSALVSLDLLTEIQADRERAAAIIAAEGDDE